MSTHGLAQKLEKISQALRELPDQSLLSLLHRLQSSSATRRQGQQEKKRRFLPPPPSDPRQMSREELLTYLQSLQHFPYKADLLEFARRYSVPVNARTPREEIVRLCLRMIYDIPKGFTILRFLADQHENPGVDPFGPLLH
jgi:hypothetical protein